MQKTGKRNEARWEKSSFFSHFLQPKFFLPKCNDSFISWQLIFDNRMALMIHEAKHWDLIRARLVLFIKVFSYHRLKARAKKNSQTNWKFSSSVVKSGFYAKTIFQISWKIFKSAPPIGLLVIFLEKKNQISSSQLIQLSAWKPALSLIKFYQSLCHDTSSTNSKVNSITLMDNC